MPASSRRLADRVAALEEKRGGAGQSLIVLQQWLTQRADGWRPVLVTGSGREWLPEDGECEDAFHARIAGDLRSPARTLHVFINRFGGKV